MPTIINKWIEKAFKKKTAPPTVSAYKADDYDILDSAKKPKERSSLSCKGTYTRTLRGLRK